MVTIYKIENTKINPDGETLYVELRGKSTETKPTTLDEKKIGNGSIFLEIDTQKLFFFDEDSQEWKGTE